MHSGTLEWWVVRTRTNAGRDSGKLDASLHSVTEDSQHPSHQVAKDWHCRELRRRDECRKFCPGFETKNNYMLCCSVLETVPVMGAGIGVY